MANIVTKVTGVRNPTQAQEKVKQLEGENVRLRKALKDFRGWSEPQTENGRPIIMAEAGVECLRFDIDVPKSLVKIYDSLGIDPADMIRLSLLDSLKSDLDEEHILIDFSPGVKVARQELSDMIDDLRRDSAHA